MTGGATFRGTACARCMLSVIELDVEAHKFRKRFDRRIARIELRVTDGAHALFWLRNEMLEVTACAGFVTGRARRGRIVNALMTRGAV